MGVMEKNLGSEIARTFNEFTNTTNNFYTDFNNNVIRCKETNSSFIPNNLYIKFFATSSVSLYDLLNRKGLLIEQWDKCFEEASKLGANPFLVFRQNGTDIFCMVTESLVTSFQFYFGRYEQYYLEFCDVYYDLLKYWILKLDDLLNFVTFEGLKRILLEE